MPGRYRLDYELRTDADLVTASIAIAARGEGGGRSLDLRRSPGGELGGEGRARARHRRARSTATSAYRPLTNFMPIHRRRLTEGGEGADFVMAWITVPDLAVHRSEQRYEPIDARTVRYVGKHRSFEGELALDEDGFVVLYPGLGERV